MACKTLPLYLTPLSSLSLRTGLKVFLLLVYCTVMIALYLAPLGITSPCIMEENQLPPKPALVGHRGAPMVSDQHRPGTVVRVDGAGCSGQQKPGWAWLWGTDIRHLLLQAWMSCGQPSRERSPH